MRNEAKRKRTKIKGFPSHASENDESKERKSRNPNVERLMHRSKTFSTIETRT